MAGGALGAWWTGRQEPRGLRAQLSPRRQVEGQGAEVPIPGPRNQGQGVTVHRPPSSPPHPVIPAAPQHFQPLPEAPRPRGEKREAGAGVAWAGPPLGWTGAHGRGVLVPAPLRPASCTRGRGQPQLVPEQGTPQVQDALVCTRIRKHR